MKKILWIIATIFLSLSIPTTHLFSQPKTYSSYIQWIRPVSTITITGDVNVAFPEVQVVSGTVSVDNFPSVYITSGVVSVDNFPSVYITSGVVSVDNFPSLYITSGTTSITNFPSVYITSGTTSLNDSVLNRVVIRNASPDRNLNINTYNGIDVRLMNNTGTLISESAPLPVNYSIFTSSYVDVNITNGIVKSGSGYLKNIIVGTAGSESSLVINDGSKKIAEIDTSSVNLFNFDISFTTNLTITTTGITPAKITIIYK